ncbi:type IV fimbrial biogenesis protein FimT [Desulfocucumis palustris]|uniref:Type IV fimbrial biogenesis protein FimT n=2 Tax=Desulfocucumis palustris TaxID=1898651 RepID=A0A2L2XGZ7_9FIRM|nr:type IV fimbrial biogenesis protein FimT [Desulfocucumis palustris]
MVASVMLLCVLPSLTRFQSAHALYSSALMLASDIRCHQQEAVGAENENATYQISFDTERDEYSLMLATERLRTVLLPGSVDLVFTNFDYNLLKFTLQGAPVSGGHVMLKDTVSGKSFYIIINPVAGRVRIDTVPPE